MHTLEGLIQIDVILVELIVLVGGLEIENIIAIVQIHKQMLHQQEILPFELHIELQLQKIVYVIQNTLEQYIGLVMINVYVLIEKIGIALLGLALQLQ